MSQSSLNVTLIFTVYGSFHPVNYLFVTFIFLLYLLTIFSNISLMLIIYVESSLHKPMYIFLFNLAINGLIGSSAVWPKIMDNLLSDTQESSYEGCLIQVFVVSVYATTAYTTLTVMAYDRYVSICKPLQYHNIMTPSKVKQLLAVVYIFPIASISVQVCLTLKLQLCRYTIQRLFCDNLSVVNLSCVKSDLLNVYGLCLTALLAVFPFFIVVLSYLKILLVSLKTSKKAQRKALITCTPHLITFINFSLASFFSVIYNRVHLHLPAGINIFSSLHFILIPPLLHPIVYGIKTQEIRKCTTKILRKNMIFASTFGFLHLHSKSPLTTCNMH